MAMPSCSYQPKFQTLFGARNELSARVWTPHFLYHRRISLAGAKFDGQGPFSTVLHLLATRRLYARREEPKGDGKVAVKSTRFRDPLSLQRSSHFQVARSMRHPKALSTATISLFRISIHGKTSGTRIYLRTRMWDIHFIRFLFLSVASQKREKKSLELSKMQNNLVAELNPLFSYHPTSPRGFDIKITVRVLSCFDTK